MAGRIHKYIFTVLFAERIISIVTSSQVDCLARSIALTGAQSSRHIPISVYCTFPSDCSFYSPSLLLNIAHRHCRPGSDCRLMLTSWRFHSICLTGFTLSGLTFEYFVQAELIFRSEVCSKKYEYNSVEVRVTHWFIDCLTYELKIILTSDS